MTTRCTTSHRLLGLGAIAALIVLRMARPAASEEIAAPGDARVAAPAAGLRIFRDPKTGQLTAPPNRPPAAAAAREPVARPVAIRRGTTPAGGTIVHGLPMATITATVDGGGKATTRCRQTPARAAD